MADREPLASDVIGKIPGFRIRGKGFNARVGSGRAPYFCLGDPTIVIDGLERQYIDDIPATTIGAIAAYRAGEIAPGNFDRGCGAILIWTKR